MSESRFKVGDVVRGRSVQNTDAALQGFYQDSFFSGNLFTVIESYDRLVRVERVETAKPDPRWANVDNAWWHQSRFELVVETAKPKFKVGDLVRHEVNGKQLVWAIDEIKTIPPRAHYYHLRGDTKGFYVHESSLSEPGKPRVGDRIRCNHNGEPRHIPKGSTTFIRAIAPSNGACVIGRKSDVWSSGPWLWDNELTVVAHDEPLTYWDNELTVVAHDEPLTYYDCDRIGGCLKVTCGPSSSCKCDDRKKEENVNVDLDPPKPQSCSCGVDALKQEIDSLKGQLAQEKGKTELLTGERNCHLRERDHLLQTLYKSDGELGLAKGEIELLKQKLPKVQPTKPSWIVDCLTTILAIPIVAVGYFFVAMAFCFVAARSVVTPVVRFVARPIYAVGRQLKASWLNSPLSHLTRAPWDGEKFLILIMEVVLIALMTTVGCAPGLIYMNIYQWPYEEQADAIQVKPGPRQDDPWEQAKVAAWRQIHAPKPPQEGPLHYLFSKKTGWY